MDDEPEKQDIVNPLGERLTMARRKAKERGVKFGPKVGEPTAPTLRRLASEKAVRELIQAKSLDLVRAGLIPAMGTVFVYKIDRLTKKAIQLKKPGEIAKAIEQITFNNGRENDEGENLYYYATAKEPDYKAIEMLLNRAYGKPKESIEVDGEIKFSLVELARRANQLQEERIQDAEYTEKLGSNVPHAEV